MKTDSTNEQLTEELAEQAFSKQSSVFDEIYAGNTIVHYKRKRVRDHVNQFLPPQSRILELNAGTGEDTVYFAGQGHHVHATDISIGMQKQLVAKVQLNGLKDRVTNEICSFTELAQLRDKGPYDLIFSNFAGLNCTDQLDKVLLSFGPLLKPGGLITLVILPRFCLWETALLLKGKFKTALRRFNSKNGAAAHIEGVHFKCWYYDPGFIINTLKNSFVLLDLEGLCTIVPPSYIEHFAEQHAGLYSRLKNMEERNRRKWPWRSIGDYYIITMRKKG